jgi:hypothetical protein
MRIVRPFLYTAAVLLLATSVAKIISSFGHSRILSQQDPLTGFLFRDLFRVVSVVEIAIALTCCLRKRILLSTSLVAWLATSFGIYRLVLLWAGYSRSCPCLGNLTDMLHISPQAADTAMKIVLGYLLLGSYATLFWLWKTNRKSSLPDPTSVQPGKSVA